MWSLLFFLFPSELVANDSIFWLTAKVNDIGWKKSCLTTTGCAQPRFQISLLNGVTNEKLTKSWLIAPQLMHVS